MEYIDVVSCFDRFTEALYRGHHGYSNTWYDVDDDDLDPAFRNFTFTIPKVSGDIYISVESYSHSVTFNTSACFKPPNYQKDIYYEMSIS